MTKKNRKKINAKIVNNAPTSMPLRAKIIRARLLAISK